MPVGVDTMILIWGLQKPHFKGGKTKQDVALMQKRSMLLLQELDDKKERIIIPTVSVAELLCGVEPKDHGSFVAEIQKHFFVVPLDLKACSLAATLMIFHSNLP